MSRRLYLYVSGSLFGVVTVLHVLRALLNLSVRIGSREVPIWPSWGGAVVALALCVWAFGLAVREDG